MPLDYHKRWFKYLLDELSPYTKKCIISFLDEYKKISSNMKDINTTQPLLDEIYDLSAYISTTASKENIDVYSCAHDFDLDKLGIKHNKCIDDQLVGDEKISALKKSMSLR